MASYQFTIPIIRIRELFDESTCSDYKPTSQEFEDFMSYLQEASSPEEMIKGMILNFWAMN